MSSNPELWLVPTPLFQLGENNDGDQRAVLSPQDLNIVHQIEYWWVETPKVARQWLKHYQHPQPLQQLSLVAMPSMAHSKSTPQPSSATSTIRHQLSTWFSQGVHAVGVMSDAGCPGIADPGQQVVAEARQLGWRIRPMVGPSSIVLALMASGLPGQHFRFLGYLPQKEPMRSESIRHAEQLARRDQETQIAIETPYRNQALLQAMLANLQASTRLCLAMDLTGEHEQIISEPVSRWRALMTDSSMLGVLASLSRKPCLFLWGI